MAESIILPENSKAILLSHQRFCIVDDADFGWLSQWRWTYAEKSGYAYRNQHLSIKIEGKWRQKGMRMHRLIMDAPKDLDVDHINHNTLDNRRCNLRICTSQQNLCNQIKWKKPTSSKYKGVSFLKSKYSLFKPWMAYIKVSQKRLYLGYFRTEEEAALAYDKAATKYFGEFAKTNFPLATIHKIG